MSDNHNFCLIISQLSLYHPHFFFPLTLCEVSANEQENNFSYVIDNIFGILAGFRLTHDLQTGKKDKTKYIYNTVK